LKHFCHIVSTFGLGPVKSLILILFLCRCLNFVDAFDVAIFSVRVRYSYAQESANDRLFNHLMMRYQKNVKPGSSSHTTRVAFSLTVLCAELDRFSLHLKTYAWLFMVGYTNLLQFFSYAQLSRLTTVAAPGSGARGS